MGQGMFHQYRNLIWYKIDMMEKLDDYKLPRYQLSRFIYKTLRIATAAAATTSITPALGLGAGFDLADEVDEGLTVTVDAATVETDGLDVIDVD
jgi:hypothetical protein